MYSCKAVSLSFQIQKVRGADLALLSQSINKGNIAGTPPLHIQIHMDLEQPGGGVIDLSWRAADYLHDPGWAGRSLVLKICCVRVSVWVSVTEPT